MMVIGGGPVGMETARVAAMRGHQVTLYEKAEKLGGQLLVATIPPHKQEISKLIKYLTNQLSKMNVQVMLGQEVTAATVTETKPEVVVVATGAIPTKLNISSTKRENVLTAVDVLAGRGQIGSKVIVIGGGMIGCETAEFLAQRGINVTIVEMLEEMGNDMLPSPKVGILRRLNEIGIKMMVKTKVEEITDEGVKATVDGSLKVFLADTVVFAVGLTPNTIMVRELAEKDNNLKIIGDCARVGKIVDAIHDGARVGQEI
jgi:NADPH-dependent 2,4-dienoyl-CoA reductase/sulfur reductase-like enzyme